MRSYARLVLVRLPESIETSKMPDQTLDLVLVIRYATHARNTARSYATQALILVIQTLDLVLVVLYATHAYIGMHIYYTLRMHIYADQ